MLAPPARSGRDVHPGLRGHPPGPAGARAGRGGRAARRADPRAHPGAAASSRAGCAPSTGTVRARHVVIRATEGYTPGLRRAAAGGRAGLLADHRDRAAAGGRPGSRSGWRRRETFTDHRHLIIYGQRTADDRLVFGGRGAPYHFGSRIAPRLRPRRAGLRARCAHTLVDLFPVLRDGPVHPRLGRRARRRPRLVRLGRAGPRDRARLGRRLRRRRRRAPPTWPAARCATWCSAATPS